MYWIFQIIMQQVWMVRKSIFFAFFAKELFFYYKFGDLTFLGWFFEVFIYNT